ncbi:MAG: YjfI family protein [Methylomicrobium sp.]|nr:YjfI family protein [Methylomicrobium sp.]
MSWNLIELESLLNENGDYQVAREESCLRITNGDGLDAYLAVSGEQILVESVLFAKKEIKDCVLLNEDILRTHQVFPLTAIAITHIDDEDYYMAFGALSSQSKKESIIIEVDTLFQNVGAFLDAYQNHLINGV